MRHHPSPPSRRNLFLPGASEDHVMASFNPTVLSSPRRLDKPCRAADEQAARTRMNVACRHNGGRAAGRRDRKGPRRPPGMIALTRNDGADEHEALSSPPNPSGRVRLYYGGDGLAACVAGREGAPRDSDSEGRQAGRCVAVSARVIIALLGNRQSHRDHPGRWCSWLGAAATDGKGSGRF
jgi:hypothetical protein